MNPGVAAEVCARAGGAIDVAAHVLRDRLRPAEHPGAARLAEVADDPGQLAPGERDQGVVRVGGDRGIGRASCRERVFGRV